MNKIATIFALLVCFIPSVGSQSIDQSIYYSEKQAVIEWITNNAHGHADKTKIPEIVELTYKEAIAKNLDPLMVFAFMRNESTFRHEAKSSHNARGLLQVVPKWHQDKIKGRSLYRVDVNIEVGTQVLRDCLDKGKDNLKRAVRCYTGGPSLDYYAKVKATRKELQAVVKDKAYEAMVASLNRSMERDSIVAMFQ